LSIKYTSINFSKIVIFSFLIVMTNNSCSDNITSDCVPFGSAKATSEINPNFAEIESKVFEQNCSVSGCHDGYFENPDLRTGKAYASLINKSATKTAGEIYVIPGNSSNSHIIKRLRGINLERMPKDSPALPSSWIDSLAKWIDNGALKN
jgi:hypothetical protein